MRSAAPALQLEHLEREGVRARMVADWTREVEDLRARLPRGRWPSGRDLKAAGWDRFLEAMPVALSEMDMERLANTMNEGRLWNPFRTQTRNGRPYQARLNVADSAVKLAHYEFSSAYTMAVAGLALEEGIATCEVYRAGFAANPRASCACLEGPGISCRAVLEGHRAYTRDAFAEVAVPAGPHSHHSIRIREWSHEAARPNRGI
jgi:hypothetical protein